MVARVGLSHLPNHTVGKQKGGRRATIKAHPVTLAPTDVDGLFVRLMHIRRPLRSPWRWGEVHFSYVRPYRDAPEYRLFYTLTMCAYAVGSRFISPRFWFIFALLHQYNGGKEHDKDDDVQSRTPCADGMKEHKLHVDQVEDGQHP